MESSAPVCIACTHWTALINCK